MGRHNTALAQLSLPFEDPTAALFGPLAVHDDLLRHLREIHFERVRVLQSLARSIRADALPRARRRVEELPSGVELERWYRVLKAALSVSFDEAMTRRLVECMMSALRGRQAPAVSEAFIISIRDARMSPQIVAGAVKRAWLACTMKPSLQAFMRICADHRRDTQEALDDVVRTMGLRRDAEHVVAVEPPRRREADGAMP